MYKTCISFLLYNSSPNILYRPRIASMRNHERSNSWAIQFWASCWVRSLIFTKVPSVLTLSLILRPQVNTSDDRFASHDTIPIQSNRGLETIRTQTFFINARTNPGSNYLFYYVYKPISIKYTTSWYTTWNPIHKFWFTIRDIEYYSVTA